MLSIVTANHLRSGAVVYLTLDGKWVDNITDAAVAADAAALADLEALALTAVEQNEVTAVYAFDVRVINGEPQPISVRERIRAAQTQSA
jgi:sulfite reductase (NADPH) hemoprotein beta-component